MKIGVDCHTLSGKPQGSRTYLLNLYNSILELQSSHEYIFFGHWGEKYFGHDNSYVDYLSDSRWKRLTYQTAPMVRKFDIDLFHSNYISPLILPCKSLLTVHDVLFEIYPQYFNKTEVIRNKILIKHSAKRAAQIHTVSAFSKQAIVDIYHVDENSIHVIPDGVNLNKFCRKNCQNASERIKKIFQIENYILSVGRLEPRKNHIGLLQAYAQIKQEEKDIGPLVIVGQKDFGFKTFFELIDKLQLKNCVKVLESVNDETLPDIYRAARLFVYPSFGEGFGIPPLEAMACGVPVITSNVSALPEVVGNAALLIDPHNTQAIADAMFDMLSNQTLANDLIARGLEQAQKWSWRNAAVSYLKSIKELK